MSQTNNNCFEKSTTSNIEEKTKKIIKVDEISLDKLSFSNEHCNKSLCGCKKTHKRSSFFDVFGSSQPKISRRSNYLFTDSTTTPTPSLAPTNLSKSSSFKSLVSTSYKLSSQKSSSVHDLYNREPSPPPSFFFSEEPQLDFKSFSISPRKKATFIFKGISDHRTNQIFSSESSKENFSKSKKKNSTILKMRNKTNLTPSSLKSLKIADETTPLDQKSNNNIPSTCSKEMMRERENGGEGREGLEGTRDDLGSWNADELSCYFEDFCHIPKKMSTMAEMMYT